MHVKNVKRFVCMSASGWNDFLIQKVNSSKYRTLSHMYLKVLIKYYYTYSSFLLSHKHSIKAFYNEIKAQIKITLYILIQYFTLSINTQVFN